MYLICKVIIFCNSILWVNGQTVRRMDTRWNWWEMHNMIQIDILVPICRKIMIFCHEFVKNMLILLKLNNMAEHGPDEFLCFWIFSGIFFFFFLFTFQGFIFFFSRYLLRLKLNVMKRTKTVVLFFLNAMQYYGYWLYFQRLKNIWSHLYWLFEKKKRKKKQFNFSLCSVLSTLIWLSRSGL